MKTFLAGIAIVAVSSLVEAWTLMVVVGILHGEWVPQLPTMGYGAALTVAVAINIALAIRTFFAEIVKAVNE